MLRCYNNIPVWLSVIHNMNLYHNTEEYSHTGVRSHGGNDQRARRMSMLKTKYKQAMHSPIGRHYNRLQLQTGRKHLYTPRTNKHTTLHTKKAMGGKPYTRTGSIHIQIHNHPIFDNYVHKADHCCEPPIPLLCVSQLMLC